MTARAAFGGDLAVAISDIIDENPKLGRDRLAKLVSERFGKFYTRDAVGGVLDKYISFSWSKEALRADYDNRVMGKRMPRERTNVVRLQTPKEPVKANWYAEGNRVIWDADDILYLEDLPLNMFCAACMQAPFHHLDILNFFARLKAEKNPEFIVLGGDILDMLFAKPKYKGPDDMSSKEEVEKGIDFIAELARMFPRAIILTSNHLEDRLHEMRRNGSVPEVFLRQWRDVYGVPDGWKIVDYLIAGRWMFEHGHAIGKGSKTAIREETVRRLKRFNVGGLTVVRAHRHTLAGQITPSEWESQTFCRAIHYMGCGMDEKQVGYNRAGLWNTALIIKDGGVFPYPMEVGMDGKWTGRIVNALIGK